MNTSAHAAVEELHAALPSEEQEMAHSQSIKSMYVYEAPVRFWHCASPATSLARPCPPCPVKPVTIS